MSSLDLFQTDAASEHEVLRRAQVCAAALLISALFAIASATAATIYSALDTHYVAFNDRFSNGSGEEAPGTSTVLVENVSFNTLDSRLKVTCDVRRAMFHD